MIGYFHMGAASSFSFHLASNFILFIETCRCVSSLVRSSAGNTDAMSNLLKMLPQVVNEALIQLSGKVRFLQILWSFKLFENLTYSFQLIFYFLLVSLT